MDRKQNVGKNNTSKFNTANLKLVMGIFSVSVVLGLTWIFGAFIYDKASEVFSYLFVLFNTFQGFVFFIFIVIVSSEGRAFWIKTLRLNALSKNLSKGNKTTGNSSRSPSSPNEVSLSFTNVSVRQRSDFASVEKESSLEEADIPEDSKYSEPAQIDLGNEKNRFEMTIMNDSSARGSLHC